MSTLIEIGSKKYNSAEYTSPSNRTFRNAWAAPQAGSDVIQINMAAAKDIWRDKIRQARIDPLASLDTAYMKAIEQGNTSEQTSIATQKQALRDAPATSAIDAALTPEELKAVQPIPNVTID